VPNEKTRSWTHQARAFWFANELRAAMLSMDMGTGKSKVAVNVAVNGRCSAVLVICPLSVVDVWPSEFAKHAPENLNAEFCVLNEGRSVAEKAKMMHRALALGKTRNKPVVVIVNYESAWREPLDAALLSTPWDLVILDESHRIKAPGGKASMYCARLGLKPRRKLCLTGTPMPHSPLDVYGQYRFLDPGIFGTSFARFKARYAVFGGFHNKQVKGYQNQDELQKRFYSIAFRVEKRDVLDLPPVTHNVRFCELGAATRKVYNEMEYTFYTEVKEHVITASNALVKLLRLQQVTSGHIEEIGDLGWEKTKLLEDVLEDFQQDEAVVVFCRFDRDLDRVRDVAHRSGREYYELSGRARGLGAWQASKSGDILGVQIRSGGVGIDLTRARYAIYYSLGFSLGDYDQSLARLDRPGQTRPVSYYHLVAKNTVDQKVYQALRDRQDAVKAVLDEFLTSGAGNANNNNDSR
jgi:SNF2 family DNA or RNA helicase